VVHQPFPSIRAPAPDFTLVLTFMMRDSFLLGCYLDCFGFGTLTHRIDEIASACLYLRFDFHLMPP